MKFYYFILFFPYALFAQQKDVTSTLLTKSMFEHIVCLKHYNYSFVQQDTIILYVQKNTFIENNLISYLETGVNLIFLDEREILKKAKNGSFFLTVINHPKIYNGFIRIDIIMYNMVIKRSILNYIKVASTIVTFKYNCSHVEYILDKVEHY